MLSWSSRASANIRQFSLTSSQSTTRGGLSSFPWSYQRRKRESNSNYCAAFFHMLTVALLCMSLAKLGWFHVESLYCSHHIAGYQFFTKGQFDLKPVSKADGINPHKFRTADTTVDERLFKNHDSNPAWVSEFHAFGKVLHCVTPYIAVVMRIALCFCIFGIICAMCAFFIDIIGSRNPTLRIIRINAVPGVLTVLACVGAIGLSSYVTMLLYREASLYSDWEPYVTFDYGYYVISAAGFLSLIGTACDMLQSRSTRRASRQRSAQRVRLLDNWDNEDTVYPDITYPSHLAPPPPYSP